MNFACPLLSWTIDPSFKIREKKENFLSLSLFPSLLFKYNFKGGLLTQT